MFSLPVSESGMSEPAPLGAPATPRGGEAQRRRLQEKQTPNSRRQTRRSVAVWRSSAGAERGCLPKGKKLQNVGKAARKERGASRGEAQDPRGAQRVGKGGIPKVAFPARVGKSPAAAAPSLAFPKGELGLNNGSI